jgi:hypothetical protein
VSEGPNGDCVTLQLVAYVWSPEAVANTSELSSASTIALFDGIDPFGDCYVGKGCVLPLPGLVVKVGVLRVVAVFAVLPHGVL